MRRVLSFITLVTRDHMGSLVGGRQMDKSCRESLVIVFFSGYREQYKERDYGEDG